MRSFGNRASSFSVRIWGIEIEQFDLIKLLSLLKIIEVASEGQLCMFSLVTIKRNKARAIAQRIFPPQNRMDAIALKLKRLIVDLERFRNEIVQTPGPE